LLLGPNGAGKSTVLKTLFGLLKVRQGRITLDGQTSIGLSPQVVQDVFRLLRRLADSGTTVLMVEQNVKSALKMADEAIAFESGRLVLHKRADELLADPHIERLFLGGAHAAAAAPSSA